VAEIHSFALKPSHREAAIFQTGDFQAMSASPPLDNEVVMNRDLVADFRCGISTWNCTTALTTRRHASSHVIMSTGLVLVVVGRRMGRVA